MYLIVVYGYFILCMTEGKAEKCLSECNKNVQALCADIDLVILGDKRSYGTELRIVYGPH